MDWVTTGRRLAAKLQKRIFLPWAGLLPWGLRHLEGANVTVQRKKATDEKIIHGFFALIINRGD